VVSHPCLARGFAAQDDVDQPGQATEQDRKQDGDRHNISWEYLLYYKKSVNIYCCTDRFEYLDMEIDSNRIQELVQTPQESLAVELKSWIDPDQTEGKAKIIKAAIAMRNHGGGYLLIGFDDKTLQPITKNAPSDVRQKFHIDKIQGLVTKYSSESFEVAVEFPERDGQEFPVIVIPVGVKTPVVAKADLFPEGKDKNPLIQTDKIYVRSLDANNTPSSTAARWKDWPQLMEVCFDNREADIGRFIRRHLNSATTDQLKIFTSAMTENIASKPSTSDLLLEYLEQSEQCYSIAFQKRKLLVPKHGCWEVGLIILGGDTIPSHDTNKQFLNLLQSSNPDYTGWPIWLDSRGMLPDDEPYVMNGVWESLIVTLNSRWFTHIDFMRLDPQGRFFLKRGREDDLSKSDQAPPPFTELDFSLPVVRTAEALAVGIAFAKGMGYSPDDTTLAYVFKWTNLEGRRLSSWTDLSWDTNDGVAHQNEVVSYVDVPLHVAPSALAQYVEIAVKPLFQVFKGFSLSLAAIDRISRRLLERR
jgi:Putative DNA-binding domain